VQKGFLSRCKDAGECLIELVVDYRQAQTTRRRKKMLSGLLLHTPEFKLFAGLLEAGLLLGCLPKIDLLMYDNVSEVSRYLGQGSTLTATPPLLSRIYLVPRSWSFNK
jgi:hypothetical protein